MTATNLTQHLKQPTVEDINVYNEQIDEVNTLPKSVRKQDYDFAVIDVVSVQNYIRKIVKSELDLTALQEETNARHAMCILRIAQLNNGVLPQKKKHSEFGRTYYEGHSVQSVHKTLREAMLGNSFEYDINSSVISWKMAFAHEYLNSLKVHKNFNDEFYGIQYYLDFKSNFYEDVLSQTFNQDSAWSLKKKTKKFY
jgi:DNA polymerase III delta prime subunit